MDTISPPLFSGKYPSALLSDMDGLLLDTETVSKITFDAMTAAYNISNGDDIFPQLVGRNKAAHEAIFTQMLPAHIDPIAFDNEWKQRFLERIEDHVPVKAGVVDFLQVCQFYDIPVRVVTSTKTAKAELLLGRAGLLPFVAGITGGDQVEQGKPHPEIYHLGAASLSVDPQNCLALEDSNNGVLSAYHAGTKVLQIPDLAPASEEILALGVPQLEKIADVPAYLKWSS